MATTESSNVKIQIEEPVDPAKYTYLGNITYSVICNQTRISNESCWGLVTAYILIILPTLIFYVFA